jgi:formylglycine-generating enzyme required for sulfatase activity
VRLEASESNTDQRPVERVSWWEATEFCHRLNQRLRQRTGRHYSLPSEAQWEYACRAGTTTAFHFGATITPQLANYVGNHPYATGPVGNYRKQTTPVGMFPANSWGLHDMHGNVLEWCLDYWHPSYRGAPTDGSAWLEPDPLSKRSRKDSQDTTDAPQLRLLRGGSWDVSPGRCRSASRDHSQPGSAEYYGGLGVGFRVVCLPLDASLNP